MDELTDDENELRDEELHGDELDERIYGNGMGKFHSAIMNGIGKNGASAFAPADEPAPPQGLVTIMIDELTEEETEEESLDELMEDETEEESLDELTEEETEEESLDELTEEETEEESLDELTDEETEEESLDELTEEETEEESLDEEITEEALEDATEEDCVAVELETPGHGKKAQCALGSLGTNDPSGH